MYAVIKTGGKQYRVTPGAVLRLERLAGDVGASVEFPEVLLAGSDEAEAPVRIGSGQDQVEVQLIVGRHVVRVTTPAGQEYWLVEDLGDGPGLRNEGLDRGVRVPLWVIRRF